MKKNILKKTLLAALAVSVLTACGQQPVAEETAPETVAEETAPEAETEVNEEESNINPPVLAAAEMYDSIISELQPGQAYAFADICSDYDVLLVADGVYDDLNGNNATIEAKVYAVNPDGEIEEFTTVTSGATAYPLAVYDGCLMVVNNARAMMEYINPEVCSVITKKCVEISYDEDGNPSCSYMDEATQSEGTVEGDEMMMEMYDIYSNATVLNFTVVE